LSGVPEESEDQDFRTEGTGNDGLVFRATAFFEQIHREARNEVSENALDLETIRFVIDDKKIASSHFKYN
jgi:hypothetical protein